MKTMKLTSIMVMLTLAFGAMHLPIQGQLQGSDRSQRWM